MKKTVWKYIKNYKFESLLVRNAGVIILGVVLPLLFLISYNYKWYSAEMNRRMENMNEELLLRGAGIFDNVIENVLELSEQLSMRKEVLHVLENETSEYDEQESLQIVTNLMEEYLNMNAYLQDIFIYSDISGLIVNTNNVKRLEEDAGKGKWYYVHNMVLLDSAYILVNDTNVVFACQQIYSDNGRKLGVIVFEMNLKKIGKLLKNEDENQRGFFFVRDASGEILYCDRTEFDSFSKKEKQVYDDMMARQIANKMNSEKIDSNKIISHTESKHQVWNYFLITSAEEYGEEFKEGISYVYTSVIWGVVLSFVVACFITYISYRPVKRILEVVENPNIEMEQKIDNRSNEAVYIISNILNSAKMRKRSEVELTERMRELRYAQSSALQLQMNPHFLYNTLETIKWCAIEDMGRGNRTAQSITKLAVLYRFSLNQENMILTLQEELKFAKAYIDVLAIRFGEKIRYEWDIDESLFHSTVIKMCIQPLVENSVNHGLKSKHYYGNIRISAFKKENEIHLLVEDDGVGLTSGEIMVMNKRMEDMSIEKGTGVGLENVNRRVKLIFGEKYGVKVSRAQNFEQGCCIKITLPYVENKEEMSDV